MAVASTPPAGRLAPPPCRPRPRRSGALATAAVPRSSSTPSVRDPTYRLAHPRRQQQGQQALGTGTLVPMQPHRWQLPELAQERVARGGRGDPDPDIPDVHAVGSGNDRVELKLGDLWQVVG